MGWSYGWNSRKALVNELLRESSYATTIAHSSTQFGRNLWMIREVKETGQRFIALCLIAKSRGEYGYKGMDESMGPVEIDCPLSFLDAVTEPESTFAKDWRKRVRAFHAKAKQELNVGDIVTIYGGETTYELLRKVKKSWHIKRTSDGRVFRATAAKMTLVPKVVAS